MPGQEQCSQQRPQQWWHHGNKRKSPAEPLRAEKPFKKSKTACRVAMNKLNVGQLVKSYRPREETFFQARIVGTVEGSVENFADNRCGDKKC